MKKTKVETKKLSIEVVTVRQLQGELTQEQLKVAIGGAERASGSKQEAC